MKLPALSALALLVCPAVLAQTAPTPEIVPPAFRSERFFNDGAAHLRALPEGAKIEIKRIDGTAFTLTLTNGKFSTTLPPAALSADRRLWTSPLGYQVFVYEESTPPGLAVVAPSGAWSTFSFFKNALVLVAESYGGFWTRRVESPIVLRLPDGVRIDMLEQGKQWETYTLNGERHRLDPAAGTWTELPRIPSPPLVPDPQSYYLGGNGDNWRLPAWEDHVVFAWNWFPLGFSAEQAIRDVASGFRRGDLDGYFNGLSRAQAPADMAACILGRRLALGGGDQLNFILPSDPPTFTLLLPGPWEPDWMPLKDDYLKYYRPRVNKAPVQPE